jgi:predicted lipoprotein with Yx(FWY)xxD motif
MVWEISVPRKHATRRSAARRLPTILLAALCAAFAAACGSSGGSGSGSGHTANGGAATVATAKVAGYGTVMATGKGTPLYIFTGDPSGQSKCDGACARQWPPLTASAKPTAGSGADTGLLSTFKRQDGRVQVLYNGHALYTHSGPSAGSAAGTAAHGGIWYLLSPAGKPITSTTGGGY